MSKKWQVCGCANVLFGLFVNSTTIEVTSSHLFVRHGPLPWSGNCSIDRSEVRGIEYRRTKRKRRMGYHVLAILASGKSVSIIRDGSDEAVFVGRRLEEHLGLPSGRVSD